MNKLIALFIALTSASAFAGSSIAVIDCQSASGRSKVRIEDWDFTGMLEKASVTVDNKTKTYEANPNTTQLISIYDFKNKVIAITVINNETDTHIQLYAIPSSVNIKDASSSTTGSFKAILNGNDPRASDAYTFLPKIEVNCTLDYSI